MPYICGKCSSAGLYRDDDFAVGDYSIVCKICGNRYYADNGRLSSGIKPVWTGAAEDDVAPPLRERPIDTPSPCGRGEAGGGKGEGSAPSGEHPEKRIEKGETTMKKERKRECANCARVRLIVGANMCWICYQGSKGLEGEDRAQALAGIKARIQSGEIWKEKRGHKSAPAAKKETTPPAGGTRLVFDNPEKIKALSGKILTEPVREIPITLKLTIEVGIRFSGVAG